MKMYGIIDIECQEDYDERRIKFSSRILSAAYAILHFTVEQDIGPKF